MRRTPFKQIGRIVLAGAIVAFALPVGASAQADTPEERAGVDRSASPAEPSATLAPAAPLEPRPQHSPGEAWCKAGVNARADRLILACTALIEADNTSVAHRATAFRLRGNSYVVKRQYDLALQDYDQSIRLNPADAVPYWNRGNLFNVDGRYDRAIEDYDQAITLNPGFFQA